MTCNIKGQPCYDLKCPCKENHEPHEKCGKHHCYKVERGVIMRQKCEEIIDNG
jgi:hypothetical protein